MCPSKTAALVAVILTKELFCGSFECARVFLLPRRSRMASGHVGWAIGHHSVCNICGLRLQNEIAKGKPSAYYAILPDSTLPGSSL